MKILLPLIDKAKESAGWLWVLNFVLGRMVPFNRAHGFRIDSIKEGLIRAKGKYKKSNFNHVRGIHACGIATVAEFSAGFLLTANLDPTRYRLIMSKIEVEYLYQAKEDIFSESTLSNERLQNSILEPLNTEDLVLVEMESRIFDTANNAIANAVTTWQIKNWKQVKTQI